MRGRKKSFLFFDLKRFVPKKTVRAAFTGGFFYLNLEHSKVLPRLQYCQI